MGRERKLFPPIVLIVSLIGASAVFAQTKYTVTDLGELLPRGINDSGEVVGGSGLHAALWTDGVITDLGTLGGRSSVAHGINNRGQIVGVADFVAGSSIRHAFLWESGSMLDLGTLGGSESEAFAINDRGQVVGRAQDSNMRFKAFLWQDGVMVELPELSPTGSGCLAVAINNRGQVAGGCTTFLAPFGGVGHAVLWENGAIQDLGTLGGPHSMANGINERGQIVGWAQESSRATTEAFLWDDGVMQAIEKIAGSTEAIASGINGRGHGEEEGSEDESPGEERPAEGGLRGGGWKDIGQPSVVGSVRVSGGAIHAFIWLGTEMIDLHDLIPGDPKLTQSTALAVNNRGQICVVESGRGADKEISAAVLLTPHRTEEGDDRRRDDLY